MVALRFTLAVATAFLATGSYAADVSRCTEQESSAYVKARLARSEKCKVQLDDFKVCDDDCYRAAKELAAIAPNCSALAGGKSSYELATVSLNECESWRAGINATYRYLPTNGTDLGVCTKAQVSDWETAYPKPTSAQRDCFLVEYTSEACTDTCLKLIEDSVTKAPACLRSELSKEQYSYGERQKKYLLPCLKSRKQNAASNAVMYSVLNGDGSFTRVTPPSEAPAGATLAPSAKTPETAPATQSTPTQAPSSSAAQPGLPIIAAVAASVAVYAAL